MAYKRSNPLNLFENLQDAGRKAGIFFNKGLASFYEAGGYRFLSKQFMLITTTGRTSGQKRTTPIGYVEGSQYIYAITRREPTVSNWFKNVKQEPSVELQIGERVLSANGQTLEDPAQVQQVLRLFLKHRSDYSRFLGVRPNASDQDLNLIADKWLAARFQVTEVKG